jgi:hypothetical protein
MKSFNDFLAWEKASRDSIDFKKIYVDVAGDLIAGLLLSQIIYWHLPDKSGRTKLRVYKQEKLWLAKQRTDWWEEIRITAKQYDRAIKNLQKLGIVEVWNTMFNAKNTPHIHLCHARLIELMDTHMDLQTEETSRFLPLGKTDIPQTSIPITENTTKNNSYVSKKRLHALSGENDFLDFYLKVHGHFLGKKHVKVTPEQEKYINHCIAEIKDTYDIELETWQEEVVNHFENLPKSNNGNILAFLKASHRYFEINPENL